MFYPYLGFSRNRVCRQGNLELSMSIYKCFRLNRKTLPHFLYYLYLLFRLVSQIRTSQFLFVGQTALVVVKDLFTYNNSPLSAVRLLLFVFDVFVT